MKNNRNTITLSKGIAIILMVIGHSRCPLILERFIYLFHMPLFFIFSGYFCKCESTGDFLSFTRKRVKGLYLPFVKWTTLFLLFHNLLANINIENGSPYSMNEIFRKQVLILSTMTTNDSLISPLWFLKSLLGSSVLIAFIHGVFKKNKGGGVINTTSLLILIFTTIFCSKKELYLPVLGETARITLASAFFLIGYMYGQFDKRFHFHRNKYNLVLCIPLLTFAILVKTKLGFDNIYPAMVIPFIITGTLGTVFIHSVCYHFHFLQKNVLYYIGNHTLYILVLHLTSFKIVSIIIIMVLHLPVQRLSEYPVIDTWHHITWIPYSLVGVLIPILIFNLEYCIPTKRENS